MLKLGANRFGGEKSRSLLRKEVIYTHKGLWDAEVLELVDRIDLKSIVRKIGREGPSPSLGTVSESIFGE